MPPVFSPKARRLAILPLLALAFAVLPVDATRAAEPAKIRVLTSTFPVFLFTKNVTKGSRLIEADLMIPAQTGCPHDYALTPQDMRKLASAQALVINGLGMEDFLEAPVKRTNPKIRIIDSAAGIAETLPDEDEDHHHDHGEHDEGPAVNPHVFASPRLAARQAINIARALGELAPAEKTLFAENAAAYAARLEALAEEGAALGKKLKQRRVVTQHGAFAYLARDLGLEVTATLAAHPGQGASAAETLALARTIRESGAGAIFTEPQYPDGLALALARECGIPSASLDPAASGPDDPPPDFYETTMRRNFATLARVLGTHE